MTEDARRRIADLAERRDSRALCQLGESHIRAGEYPLAEAAFRAAYAVGETVALRSLAWVLEVAGNLDEAEQTYREAIEAGDGMALVDLADLIFVQPGRGAEAEDLLGRAVAAEVPTAYYVLGKVLARQPGREAEAEAALTAETEPSLRPVALWELAHVLRRMPNRDAEVESALRASGTAQANLDLAQILYTRPGGQEEAITLFRRAAEMGRHGAWSDLTVLLKELGRDDEAAAAYADAIRAGEIDLIVFYGDFLQQRGMTERAEDVLRQGLGLDPRCDYVLGAMLLGMPGRLAEGRRLLIAAATAGIVSAALELLR